MKNKKTINYINGFSSEDKIICYLPKKQYERELFVRHTLDGSYPRYFSYNGYSENVYWCVKNEKAGGISMRRNGKISGSTPQKLEYFINDVRRQLRRELTEQEAYNLLDSEGLEKILKERQEVPF